jgi:hypothetical protein
MKGEGAPSNITAPSLLSTESGNDSVVGALFWVRKAACLRIAAATVLKEAMPTGPRGSDSSPLYLAGAA